MKNLKYKLVIFLSMTLVFFGCQEDILEFGDIVAPSNIEVSVTYIDNGTESAVPGLGSGEVRLSATADNATAIHFVVQGQTKLQESGGASHIFATLGNNTYPVTVIAYGTGGASSSKTIEIEVLSLYEPPADLLEMLYGNGTKTWRIKSEAANHFGLGPAGGPNPFEYYGAGPGDKTDVGMYDDRYIFSSDGTFQHITNGTVFGREVLIDELGGSAGTPNGADIENYNFSDYTEQWSLTAPSDVETINLSGLGFIGYYVGGDHKYKIVSRSANEMVIKTTDGNGEFDWGFTLIAE